MNARTPRPAAMLFEVIAWGGFALLASTLLSNAVAQSSAEEEPASEADALPPRKKIAGLRGFSATSKVIFKSAPDRPHRIQATYVFPDRARWSLVSEENARGQRVLRYRYGTHVYGLDAGQAKSVEFQAAHAHATTLQLELRRAAMLWPDGFDWKPVEGGRRADLGEAGHLFAQGATEEDRPKSVTSHHADGTAFESFAEFTWSEPIAGRVWPATMVFSAGGAEIWREAIQKVDARGHYVDDFFRPPDRRVLGRTQAVGADATRPIDLPRQVSRRISLEGKLEWDAAIAAAQQLRQTIESEIGASLDRLLSIEIDEAGQPVAYLARLGGAPEEVPSGWRETPPTTGWTRVLTSPSQLGAKTVTALRTALPKGSRPGPIYARLDPTSRSTPIQVVLPLRP